MRPRLLHLGYTVNGAAPGLAPGHFNEAEAFTPRICPPAMCHRGHPQDFNEAEAFTPRIAAGGAAGAARYAHFNEAEAFTPRIRRKPRRQRRRQRRLQ